jgi:hypothetical protein
MFSLNRAGKSVRVMATLPACPLLLDLQIKELNAWAGDHTRERGPGLGGGGLVQPEHCWVPRPWVSDSRGGGGG